MLSGFRWIKFLFVILKSNNFRDVVPKKKITFYSWITPTIMMLIREVPKFSVSRGTTDNRQK